MKRLLALACVVVAATPASSQTNVGVSVGIHQPGVYGRIDIGNFPPPPRHHGHPGGHGGKKKQKDKGKHGKD